MPFNDQFVKCSKCGNQVAPTYLDSRGICVHCRTMGRPTDWEMREQKRLEKQAAVVKEEVCEFCHKPKRGTGFCRNCGK